MTQQLGDVPFDFDVFISHATEDKDRFVRPLAEALEAAGITPWYDEWSLTLGDRLRRTIDAGLRRSRFGLVVLSPRFFEKRWPQQELDGLAALEAADGTDRILPIWLDVGHADVAAASPMLADRMAFDASRGIEAAVADIGRALERTPRSAPVSQPVRRAQRKRDVDTRLRARRLVGDEGDDFGINEDSSALWCEIPDPGDRQAIAILSLVPVGVEEELDGTCVWEWAKAGEWHDAHPLSGGDRRPRADGMIVRNNNQGVGLSRYTLIAGDGYVEWGRALGGHVNVNRNQGAAEPTMVSVLRLGPLLWAASHLVTFLAELKERFDLRADYELIISIARAHGAVLTHLGSKWSEPWSGFRDFRPTTNDDIVQYRRSLPAAIGEEERRAMLLGLDRYLNRVWGVDQPRGHDHPDNGGQLSDQYQLRDPWEDR